MSRQQEGKRQLKNKRKMTVDFEFLPEATQPLSQDPSSRFGHGADGAHGSFSQNLFNNETSVKIRNAVKESTFFQEMASGTLDPDLYGGYMVQDAAYCFNAVKALDYASSKMQAEGNPRFSLFYRVQSESFQKYNQEYVKTWRLKNTDSVVMGTAAAMYVGYEDALSRKDPKYLAIAMLPCTLLWPWITGQLISSVDEKNPYHHWFVANKPDDSMSQLEKFVDYFFTPEEEKKSLVIFHEGMINELNFFREACNESLYYYPYFSV